jgi:hypothetical protein
MTISINSPRRIAALLAPAVIGLLIAGAGAADAKSAAEHARSASKVSPKIVGATKGICVTGFDTETGILTPPDDSTSDNVAAGTVTLIQKCSGVAVGRFTSEVVTSGAGDFIHIDMRATCVGTGGFTAPCTVGQQIFASPGHSFFQNNVQPGFEVNGINMVWSGLKPGVWKYEVLPGGNNHAFLDFRTFTVEALKQ